MDEEWVQAMNHKKCRYHDRRKTDQRQNTPERTSYYCLEDSNAWRTLYNCNLRFDDAPHGPPKNIYISWASL